MDSEPGSTQGKSSNNLPNRSLKRAYPRYFEGTSKEANEGEGTALEFDFAPKHSKIDKTALLQSPQFWSNSEVATISSTCLARLYNDGFGSKVYVKRLSGKGNATTFEVPLALVDILVERLQELLSKVRVTPEGRQFFPGYTDKPEYQDFFDDKWWEVPVTVKIVNLFLRPYTSSFDKVCIRIWQKVPEQFHKEYEGKIWKGGNSFFTLCTAKALVDVLKKYSEDNSEKDQEAQVPHHV